MAFETTIKRARFEVSGYSPTRMIQIAGELTKSIGERIMAARNVYDAPALPLRPGYAKWKARKRPNIPTLRNWMSTTLTMHSLKVLEATDNRAVIGFIGAEANKRAAINNWRERQFGVSPVDRAALQRAVNKAGPPVQIKVR